MSGNPNTLPRLSPGGLAAVVLAHVGILAALMSLRIVPVPQPLAILMVRVVAEAPPAPPDVVPPKPRPLAPRIQPRPLPEPPARVLATEAPEPVAQPEVARLPEPRPMPPVQAAPSRTPAPEAAPVIAPPRFDADYLDNPGPIYPALSRRLHEEGEVVLRVRVEPNGRPSQIEVKSGSGFPRLDQSARDAVARWKFVPARQGDAAVGAWVLVPVVFSLKE